MSNHLAIATVTAALQQRLIQAVAGSGVSNAFVTTERPDQREKDNRAGVNIFLFQVDQNVQYRNANLPMRRSDGSLSKKPAIVLDLNYLISFHGENKTLEPQRLMGAVASNLNALPTLSPAEIKDNVITPSASAPNTDPRKFLGQSDLPTQPELVRFTLSPATQEELQHLWSLFDQTSYSLSLLYKASVVIIEPSDLVPQPALPVQQPLLYVRPFAEPLIRQVSPTIGAGLPITAGATLIVEGTNLRGEVTRVVVGGEEIAPASDQLTPTRIQVPLPASLSAGLHGLQVVHRLLMGDPPTEHRGFESNVAGVVLQPVISAINKSGASTSNGKVTLTLTLTVQPQLRKDQRVSLLLNRTSGKGEFAFSIPPLSADAPSVAIQAQKIDPGEYYVRLQVDGAESPLIDLNPASPSFGEMVGPKVSIP